MRSFIQNAIGMLAAGVLASGLVLAAWALNPIGAPAHEPDTATPPRADQIVGRWSFAGDANPQAFIEFTEYGSWFGSDGCNGMQGGWGIDSAALVMQPAGPMTLIACDNATLPAGGSDGIVGSLTGSHELRLTGDGGETVMLHRIGDSEMSLTGSTWGLEDDSDPAIAHGARPEIAFAADGTWVGTDGCNRMSGTWSSRTEAQQAAGAPFGAVLTIGDQIMSTKMACEHESPFPAELTQPHRLAVLSDQAVLLQDPAGDDTQAGIFLRRADPAQ